MRCGRSLQAVVVTSSDGRRGGINRLSTCIVALCRWKGGEDRTAWDLVDAAEK